MEGGGETERQREEQGREDRGRERGKEGMREDSTQLLYLILGLIYDKWDNH